VEMLGVKRRRRGPWCRYCGDPVGVQLKGQACKTCCGKCGFAKKSDEYRAFKHGSSSYYVAKDIDITLWSISRYERAIELADEGAIELHDWTKHGNSDAIYIHASPDWVQKNINSPIWDPISNPSKNAYWNPISSAARRAKNEEAARQYLLENGATGVLSSDAVDQEALDSITALCVALGNDPDMERLDLDLKDIVLYTGITKQKDVWNECLRWLTMRGLMRSDGSFSGSQNRPTLVWADGRCITMLVP